MASGSVQPVVVCQPVQAATAQDVEICGGSVAGQAFAPRAVNAYVLDPSQAAAYEAALAPFDYAYASGIWGFAFSMVVGLYVVTHGIGHVLGMIRRG
jgi:hypothetical protein